MDKEIFKIDEVWKSSGGILYRVVEVNKLTATLRRGFSGDGRRLFRWVDDTHNWVLMSERRI